MAGQNPDSILVNIPSLAFQGDTNPISYRIGSLLTPLRFPPQKAIWSVKMPRHLAVGQIPGTPLNIPFKPLK